MVSSKIIGKSKEPVLYYNNCSATQRLISSDDMERNPGLAETDNPQIITKYDQFHTNKLAEIAMYPLQKLDAFAVFQIKIYQN